MSLFYTAYTKDISGETPEEQRRIRSEIAASSVLVANSQPDLNVIRQIIHEVQNTKIGKLKFIAKKRIGKIDIDLYSSLRQFDGWCYPDGRPYNEKYFPHLKSAFPSGKLPDLRSFFKPHNSNDPADLSEIPYSNQVPAHKHQINAVSANPITVKNSSFVWITGFETGHTEFNGKYYDRTEIKNALALHGACSSTSDQVRLQPMSVTSPTGSQTITGQTAQTGVEGEAYPAYNDMPVLMFIGFPTL